MTLHERFIISLLRNLTTSSVHTLVLIIKFCHHNRDVRPPSPSPPLPLLIMIFMIFIILLMQFFIKIRHHNRDFECPDCGGKNPDLAGRPGSGGGDCFHGSKKL